MVVRRFKFEEPRMEQIQDLEVCICIELTVNFPGLFYLYHIVRGLCNVP